MVMLGLLIVGLLVPFRFALLLLLNRQVRIPSFVKDLGLLVEQLGVGLVSLHVFEKSDVVFDLALRVHNVVGLAHGGQRVLLTVVVLKSDLILRGRVHSMMVLLVALVGHLFALFLLSFLKLGHRVVILL